MIRSCSTGTRNTLSSRPSDGRKEDALTSQETYLPEELPCSVRDDDVLSRLSEVLDNLDGALEDDDQVIGLIAVSE